jgi:hypothetical protein
MGLETMADNATPVGTSRVVWADTQDRGQPAQSAHTPAMMSSPLAYNQPPILPDSPDVAATREQPHYRGAHPGLPDPSLRVPPVNTYRPSLPMGSRAQQGGALPDGPYPPYFAYGSRARNNKDNARYGGARANQT